MNRQQMLERLAKGEDPLDISIQKWEDIVNGKGHDEGRGNCALCEKYFGSFYNPEQMCIGCPVMIHTGSIQCKDTPYENYSDEDYCDEDKEDLADLAKKELEFLKSLKNNNSFWVNL